MGTVTIYRTRFLEDDIIDGDYPRDDTDTVVVEDMTASEAARLIKDAGLSFAVTGNAWAANPDGSYVSNYSTGERVEESAHLSGFHPRTLAAIIRAVEGSE